MEKVAKRRRQAPTLTFRETRLLSLCKCDVRPDRGLSSHWPNRLPRWPRVSPASCIRARMYPEYQYPTGDWAPTRRLHLTGAPDTEESGAFLCQRFGSSACVMAQRKRTAPNVWVSSDNNMAGRDRSDTQKLQAAPSVPNRTIATTIDHNNSMQQCGPILPRKHLLQTLLRSPTALYSREILLYQHTRSGPWYFRLRLERGQIDPLVHLVLHHVKDEQQ
jgi:hypothetical protein